MRSTVWLTQEEISEIKEAMLQYVDDVNANIANSILKEISVAHARAESNRLLSHNYKQVIGKEETQVPLRLDSMEIIFIQASGVSESLKDKLA